MYYLSQVTQVLDGIGDLPQDMNTLLFQLRQQALSNFVLERWWFTAPRPETELCFCPPDFPGSGPMIMGLRRIGPIITNPPLPQHINEYEVTFQDDIKFIYIACGSHPEGKEKFFDIFKHGVRPRNERKDRNYNKAQVTPLYVTRTIHNGMGQKKLLCFERWGCRK